MALLQKKQSLKVSESFTNPKLKDSSKNHDVQLLLLIGIPKNVSAALIFKSISKLIHGPIEKVQLFRLDSGDKPSLHKTITGSVYLYDISDHKMLIKLGFLEIVKQNKTCFVEI